jgi:hypothetical protein
MKKLLYSVIALLCITCCTNNVFAGGKRIKKGNTVTYNGNVFELPTPPPPDTATVVNPETGDETIMIRVKLPTVTKMNGKTISYEFNYEDGSKGPKGLNTDGMLDVETIEHYLAAGLKEEVEKLGDGTYHFNIWNIVVGENGKIVYYDSEDIYSPGASMPDKTVQKKFSDLISNLLDNIPAKKPATLNGKPVPFRHTNNIFSRPVLVRDGVASFE